MKETLMVGLTHIHKFRVPENKTVPYLYPEAPAFREMPKVFATGFMIGLFEWACIEAMAPHLDPGEGSVGTMVNVTHTAATPPGMEVTVHVRCIGVEGRRTVWEIEAKDESRGSGRGPTKGLRSTSPSSTPASRRRRGEPRNGGRRRPSACGGTSPRFPPPLLPGSGEPHPNLPLGIFFP